MCAEDLPSLPGVNNPYFGEHVAGKQGQNWFGVASPCCSGCMEHKILSAVLRTCCLYWAAVPRAVTRLLQQPSCGRLELSWELCSVSTGTCSPLTQHAAPLDTGVCLVTGSSLSPCPCLHCSLQRKLSHSVSRGEDSHLPCSFSWGSFLSCCLQPYKFTSLDTWC